MVCVVLWLLSGSTTHAQTMRDGIDAVAKSWVAAHNTRYGGDRTEHPEETDRPRVPLALRAVDAPLAIHATADLGVTRTGLTMAALTAAADALRRMGWDRPVPDGGLGGTTDFDLYVLPADAESTAPRADAFADGEVLWGALDSVAAFAVMRGDVPADRWVPCVTAAYANAVLLGTDPAEAPGFRRATAEWLAFRITGETCEGAEPRAQRASWRAWIDDESTEDSGDRAGGDGGALLWELLSERYDAGAESMVYDAWQLARQRSPGRDGLRGEPDLWQSLRTLLKMRGERFIDAMANIAVARWFTGPGNHTGAAWLAGEAPPLVGHFAAEALPKHGAVQDPPVGVLGSVYAVVDVRHAKPKERLRVWSQGEYGVDWSLMAVRLDENGREIARLDAPIIERKPNDYLVVEPLTNTATVLLVATNLGHDLPDADLPSVYARSVKFVIDHATD